MIGLVVEVLEATEPTRGTSTILLEVKVLKHNFVCIVLKGRRIEWGLCNRRAGVQFRIRKEILSLVSFITCHDKALVNLFKI